MPSVFQKPDYKITRIFSHNQELLRLKIETVTIRNVKEIFVQWEESDHITRIRLISMILAINRMHFIYAEPKIPYEISKKESDAFFC